MASDSFQCGTLGDQHCKGRDQKIIHVGKWNMTVMSIATMSHCSDNRDSVGRQQSTHKEAWFQYKRSSEGLSYWATSWLVAKHLPKKWVTWIWVPSSDLAYIHIPEHTLLCYGDIWWPSVIYTAKHNPTQQYSGSWLWNTLPNLGKNLHFNTV